MGLSVKIFHCRLKNWIAGQNFGWWVEKLDSELKNWSGGLKIGLRV